MLTNCYSEFGLNTGTSDAAKLAASNLSANIVSVMQAGAFAGALIANPISDRYGRRPGLLLAATFCAVGAVLQAASSGHLACMYVGRYVSSSPLLRSSKRNQTADRALFRFVAGLGLGGATMLTPTYISENAPRGIRGMLVGLYQLFETMGAMIAFWV